MEKYKKVVIIRLFLLSILALLAVGLGIYDVFWATAEEKASNIFGFQCGGITALGILALIWIIRYRKVLRNERELKIQYDKENDERMKAIRAKAGMPMVLITSIVMIVLGIIIGYSNMTVFYALIAAAAAQLGIACVTKFIYTKIM